MSGHPPINREKLATIRAELGAHFPRILGYFAEDGLKSLNAVEEAVRNRDAVALVRPAHTLKGESLQFGADDLGYTAERVEHAARDGVERHAFPLEIVEEAMRLRPLFEQAIAILQREAAPPVAPQPVIRRAAGGFGRKVS